MKRQLATGLLLALALTMLNQACKHDPFDPPVVDNPTDSTDTTGTDTTDTTGMVMDTTLTPADTMAVVTGECDPDTIYFNRDLMPIFLNNCALGGCHNASSASAGVIMDNYLNVFNTTLVKPGDPDNSELYTVLIETDPVKRMPKPPFTPLLTQEIEMVRNWILQGANNFKCTTVDTMPPPACDTANISYNNDVIPIFNSYNCINCHSGGNTVTLNTYAGTKTAVDSGRMAGAINHENGFQSMPLGGSIMDSCDLAKVNAWIDAGAPNN